MYDVWKKSFLKVIQVCQRRMNWKSELKSFSSDRKKNVWGKDIWCNFIIVYGQISGILSWERQGQPQNVHTGPNTNYA